MPFLAWLASLFGGGGAAAGGAAAGAAGAGLGSAAGAGAGATTAGMTAGNIIGSALGNTGVGSAVGDAAGSALSSVAPSAMRPSLASSLFGAMKQPYQPMIDAGRDTISTFKNPNANWVDKGMTIGKDIQIGNQVANGQNSGQSRQLVGQPKQPQFTDAHLSPPDKNGIRYFTNAGKQYAQDQLTQ